MPDYPLHDALAAFHGHYPVFQLADEAAQKLEARFVDPTGFETAELIDVLIQRSKAMWEHARALAPALRLPACVVHTILEQIVEAYRDGKTVDDVLDYLNARRVNGCDTWSADPVLQVAATLETDKAVETRPPPEAIP